ncbi:MAG: hypothetical protein JXR68_10790 [Bacteroidales bacterium]|nr:hypothetical protein [Bacteroidales bacterium]
MKKLISFVILFFMIITTFAQDPFQLYVEKDTDWYPTIFQKYIEQYAGIKVNKYLIDENNTETIKIAIEQFDYTETKDFDQAIDAVQHGQKVFFFIETWVWGGLELGTVFSGSWQRQMPMCSGFYIHQKKCFQNQGINYHCGKKDNAHEVVFIIVN